MNALSSLMPAIQDLAGDIDLLSYFQAAAVFVLVIFGVGAILRAVFGLGSDLTRAVSASLTVCLVYLATILLYVFVPELRAYLNHLPFMSVNQERLFLWDIYHLSREMLFGSLLKMAILAFLVNVLESFLPEGRKFITWYLWRCVTVLVALAGYILICMIVERCCPQLFGSWAMYVVLGYWALVLLTGLLKMLMTVVLTALNPVLGGLYAFFFSHAFGKQFSKAILTTLVMAGIVMALNKIGFTQFAFSQFTLAAYGPTCVLVIVVLYLFGKLL